MDEGISAFNILTCKPTGKRPLGSPRHKWEGNIRMALKEIGVSTRNWVGLAHDRDHWRAFADEALYLRVP